MASQQGDTSVCNILTDSSLFFVWDRSARNKKNQVRIYCEYHCKKWRLFLKVFYIFLPKIDCVLTRKKLEIPLNAVIRMYGYQCVASSKPIRMLKSSAFSVSKPKAQN